MKKTTMLLAGAVLAAAGLPALALDFQPDGAALQAGLGKNGTSMAGVALLWDWDFERLRRKAELTAHTELMVNRWRYDAADGVGKDQLTQLVLLPTLRMRLARGASPWFIEMGIGASFTDRAYETPRKRFSTRWNFYDVLGVGHTFGADGRHEVGLRLNHVSNGGFRHPNPGENFVQLRYMARF